MYGGKKIREIIKEEKEKLSGLTWKKRLGYIWDYYKPLMAAVLSVIAAVGVGAAIYHNAQQKSLLNVYIMDCYASSLAGNAMAEEFEEYLGGLDEDEYVLVDTQLIAGSGATGQFDMSNQMKFAALANAHEVDMVILNQETYDSFLEKGYLMELDGLLSEEQKNQWADLLAWAPPWEEEETDAGEQAEALGQDGTETAPQPQHESQATAQNPDGSGTEEMRIFAVKISDSEVLERYQAYGGAAVYAGLFINSERTEYFDEFCAYLLS